MCTGCESLSRLKCYRDIVIAGSFVRLERSLISSVALVSKPFDPLLLTFLAGTPAIVIPSSRKERLTTELASIAALSAIVTSPMMTAPGPMKTLFPIRGALSGSPIPCPMVTQWRTVQFSPTRASRWTITGPRWIRHKPGPKTLGEMLKPTLADKRLNRYLSNLPVRFPSPELLQLILYSSFLSSC